MEIGLIIIIIALVIYCGFKDLINAKHLERLELRLKGMEPTELDNIKDEELSNSIIEEKYVDLSMADPSSLAESLAKAVKNYKN